MEIFLFIIVELATIAGSMCILLKGAIDTYLEFPKMGYKVDNQAFEECKRNSEPQKQKKQKFHKALGVFYWLTPGLNLIVAGVNALKMKSKGKKFFLDNNLLIPMTKEELIQYNHKENKKDKFMYLIKASNKKENFTEIDIEKTNVYVEEIDAIENRKVENQTISYKKNSSSESSFLSQETFWQLEDKNLQNDQISDEKGRQFVKKINNNNSFQN